MKTPFTQVINEIYAHFSRGEVAAILAHLHEDVEWEHDSVDHGIPWLAPRRGRAAVAGFFESLSRLEIKRFQTRGLFAQDRCVAALVEEELMVKTTGRLIRDLAMHLWTFNECGEVVRFKHLVDTHQHFLAWHNSASPSQSRTRE